MNLVVSPAKVHIVCKPAFARGESLLWSRRILNQGGRGSVIRSARQRRPVGGRCWSLLRCESPPYQILWEVV